MTDDDAVPTAGPTEATYRVSWQLLEVAVDQLTVRIGRPEPAPEDSDGIPQAVDAEVSVRGRGGIVSSGHVTADTYVLNDAQKITVMVMVAELAFRHGHGDLIEYPIMTASGPKVLVLKLRAFSKWFQSVADLNFDEMQPLLRPLHYAARAGAVPFLHALARVLPSLRQFDDTPHLLLEL